MGWLRLGFYAGVVFGLLYLGNAYGPNAHWRASRTAEDRARNAVLSDLAERDQDAGEAEDRAHEAAQREFDELRPGLQQCVLDDATASALNIIRERR